MTDQEQPPINSMTRYLFASLLPLLRFVREVTREWLLSFRSPFNTNLTQIDCRITLGSRCCSKMTSKWRYALPVLTQSKGPRQTHSQPRIPANT